VVRLAVKWLGSLGRRYTNPQCFPVTAVLPGMAPGRPFADRREVKS